MKPLPSDVVTLIAELKRRGVALGLERMAAFAAALGDPHRAVPVIHVAGTNGKGSVAAMLERILREAGWRVGLYTSPHLVRLGERIQIDRQPIANDALAELVREAMPVVEKMKAAGGTDAGPSYFEFMTGLAFRHFARAKCDVAVIEVGVGGRLDATNIVDPELSIITSIGLDHAEFLGDTVAKIAREKAGIVKPGRPVLLGRLPIEAEVEIRDAARRSDALVLSVRECFGDDVASYPTTNLAGEFQRMNAGTAALAAGHLRERWKLNQAVVARALMDVEWAGRWQSVTVGGRRVIVDASHNAEGALALDRNLRELADSGPAPVVVCGVLGESRARPLLAAIARHAAEIRLVVPRQSRASSYEVLEVCVPADFRGRVGRTSVEQLFPNERTVAADLPVAAPVVVTGSIYLAGEVLARLQPERGPLEAELQDF